MNRKLGPALIAGLAALLLTQACIFGGDDGGGPSGSRLDAVPTATLPATMADPVLLGQGGATTSGEGTGDPSIPGGASGETYVVESGDTLGGIAAALGIPAAQQAAWIAEVQRLNEIADPRSIGVGDELLLPRVEGATAPEATPTPPAEATNTPAAGGSAPTPTVTPASGATPTPSSASGDSRTYTVESGDNPYLIGQKLGVPANQLAAWSEELIALNDINANGLSIGQVLELPASTPD